LPKREVPVHRPEAFMSREEIALRTRQSRAERYLRTAHFVQSKWFMIGASVAIIVFLIITFLISR
jgi:ABC-type multidrug transport system permease subunit